MRNAIEETKRPIMGYSGNLTIRPGDLIAELFEPSKPAGEKNVPASAATPPRAA